MRGSNSKPMPSVTGSSEEVDWELRPGGMLVQKREDGNGDDGPMIKVKVSHDSYLHDVTVPVQSTFGELKRILSQETGLKPEEQRLLFRGKEKDDDDCLHMSGVKDLSKLVLLEDPASKERKLELMKKDQRIFKAYEAIAEVRTEVDKLIEKVNTLASAVQGRIKFADQEFVVLTELLMRQLLKLDSIEAEGDAKVHRRNEVKINNRSGYGISSSFGS
ncbi:hypothetical protein HPP92_023461 [Vanilla planifolia]|uniref:BAG family molecular chaperone regulator 4 n=1 Tax=Vanilla planifolia TaxID=51239 RepID=A0A835PWM5_VANPL|nr:hypothetical protein HPP92_023461 [Vanilla planifolia]